MASGKFARIAVAFLLMSTAGIASDSRRATITGRGGEGRCSIEVSVDGAAEVDIFGDTAVLRTVSGQPATWRRFECGAALPDDPTDLRLVPAGGRGRVTLVRNPGGNRATATIRISDPQSGRGVYAFDLLWRPGGWPPAGPGPGRGPWHGGSPMQTAIRGCQDAVSDRLGRDGYRFVTFERTIPDSRPGGYDRVAGYVSGRRGPETSWFGFSCLADFRSGVVRSVDVRRQ